MKHSLILFCFLLPISLTLATRRIGIRNWQYWVVILTANVMFEAGKYF